MWGLEQYFTRTEIFVKLVSLEKQQVVGLETSDIGLLSGECGVEVGWCLAGGSAHSQLVLLLPSNFPSLDLLHKSFFFFHCV